MEWHDVKEHRPPPGEPVLASVVELKTGVSVVARAYRVDRFMLLAIEHYDDASEYNEDDDLYYAKPGWYENNLKEEAHWSIEDGTHKVTHWMFLPQPPSVNDKQEAI